MSTNNNGQVKNKMLSITGEILKTHNIICILKSPYDKMNAVNFCEVRHMGVSYKKLWKLLIDKDMKKKGFNGCRTH